MYENMSPDPTDIPEDHGVDMTAPATVRMRGDDWTLAPATAARLEREGVIWRDYDCEQNTRDNGWTLGPCYGVVGESESIEEAVSAAILDKAQAEDGAG